MKKLIIGALVGGLILFFWQYFSWAMLPVHAAEMQYTPNQDAVIEALSKANLEEGGTYFIPRAPEGLSSEEEHAIAATYIGKPWAQVTYHNSLEMKMGMNMFRGFLIDFVSVLLLCWILLKFAHLDFKTALFSSVAVGLIGYLTISYLNNIWFETNSLGHLVDTLVQWSVCGAWLGFWLPEKD